MAPGGVTTAQLGTVTVTDNRSLGSAAWTATVTGTALSTGTGGGQQKIPAGEVTYWSGPATSSSGSGTFTPGQLTAANAQALSASRVAFSLTGGSGVNSASWNQALIVHVLPSVVARHLHRDDHALGVLTTALARLVRRSRRRAVASSGGEQPGEPGQHGATRPSAGPWPGKRGWSRRRCAW